MTHWALPTFPIGFPAFLPFHCFSNKTSAAAILDPIRKVEQSPSFLQGRSLEQEHCRGSFTVHLSILFETIKLTNLLKFRKFTFKCILRSSPQNKLHSTSTRHGSHQADCKEVHWRKGSKVKFFPLGKILIFSFSGSNWQPRPPASLHLLLGGLRSPTVTGLVQLPSGRSGGKGMTVT